MGPAASQTQGYDLRDASDRGLRRMVTFDPVAAFIATLVIFDGFLPLLPARDAGAYPLVL